MNTISNRYILLPVVALFGFYMIWLFRAYHDIAYMDQIQIVAGNIDHMFNRDTSLLDYYYRPPFLFFISTIIVFINCKLFSYNTFYETITSGLILLFIAGYFIRSNISFFKSNKEKFYFSLLVSVIIFSFSKWEMSLWGGGFSHYMVVLFGFISINIANNYYLHADSVRFSNRYFVGIYIFLSVISTLETTSYFLPFQVSLLILTIMNYKLFKEKINLKRWKIVLRLTIFLLIFSFLINYLIELYSIHHPYDAYGKVNLSGSLGGSFKEMISNPIFAIKFFLISNAGNLVDKDSYLPSTLVHNIMPFLGMIILFFSLYAIFLFIKNRNTKTIFAVNLLVAALIFNITVLIGRMGFNDAYYGASSRYSALTFSGVLGLSIFFYQTILEQKDVGRYKQFLYSLPIYIVIVGTMIINKNQWQIAPYRKENFFKMEYDLKKNKNLESLMGYNNDITSKAREVLIRNKLNIFKPEKKLNNFFLPCEKIVSDSLGFYSLQKDEYGNYKWSNGDALMFLPNLYTIKDTIHVKLMCYSPQADTPKIILNDNLSPFQIKAIDRGYDYLFVFEEQKVLFKMSIKNKSVIPHEINKNSPDDRKLGLMFRSVNLYE